MRCIRIKASTTRLRIRSTQRYSSYPLTPHPPNPKASPNASFQLQPGGIRRAGRGFWSSTRQWQRLFTEESYKSLESNLDQKDEEYTTGTVDTTVDKRSGANADSVFLDDLLIESESTETTPLADSDEINDLAGSAIDANIYEFTASKHWDRNIYILGTSSTAVFMAHTLAGIPRPPPITILCTTKVEMDNWNHARQRTKITKRDFAEEREGVRAQYMMDFIKERSVSTSSRRNWRSDVDKFGSQTPRYSSYSLQSDGTMRGYYISHLIVATPGPTTVKTLRPLVDFLTESSTICFMPLGMGVTEEVTKELFPLAAGRPRYMQALSSHSYWKTDHFQLKYAGQGTLALSQAPQPAEPGLPVDFDNNDSWIASTRYLLWTFTRAPVLAAYGLSPAAFHQIALDRLAIRACTEPLTAIMDCENGKLLYNDHVMRLIRLLLTETCVVFQGLPELQGRPNVNTRFNPARIERRIITRLNMSAFQQSSTLKSLRFRRNLEIEYLNGYVVKRGEEQGIHCVTHYTMMHTVLALRRLAGSIDYGKIALPGTARP